MPSKQIGPRGRRRPLYSERWKDLFLQPLIEEALWEEANWQGVTLTVLQDSADSKKLPVMSLEFEDISYGLAIIADWYDRLEGADQKDLIKISIVEAENGHYILIAIDAAKLRRLGKSRELFIPADHQLGGHQKLFIPGDRLNGIEQFRSAFEALTFYVLTASSVGGSDILSSLEEKRYTLGKTKIRFKHIKDLTAKDFESFILRR